MVLQNWMNSSLPEITSRLHKSIEAGYHVETRDDLGLAGRLEIYDILDAFLSVLFPGCYCKKRIENSDMHFFINQTLRYITHTFFKHLRSVYEFRCQEKQCEGQDCSKRAKATLRRSLSMLPEIRLMLIKDIDAAYHGDPAATCKDEIVLSYPFVDAIATHRVAHLLYKENVPIIPRIMSERAHSRTGIDIHPGAEIGEGFFIDHGTGVVIGETCRIGKNVKIYQGVTLGALSPFDKEGKPRKGEKRHPDIEDDVIIYANATILGGKTVIGRGAVIGGNTWITQSVDAGAVVYNRGRNSQSK